MFRLSRESIQMQSPIFFKELALAYENLRKLKPEDMTASDEARVIEAIIKHHTNLKVDLSFDPDQGPAVSFPQVTKNHPLVANWRKEFANNHTFIKQVNSVENIRGSVNLKTGKVQGVFLDVPISIYMNSSLMKNEKFSNEEIAAMNLHEIGHSFVYFEYITRSVSTNQVLAAMSKELSQAETSEQREAILISTKKALKLGTNGLGELSKSTDTKAVEAVVVAAVIEEARAELGNNIYDSTSWEYLSDEYASRYGAGKYLVTALDKLHRQYGTIYVRSNATFIAYEAFKLLFILASISPLVGIALPIAMILVASDGANPEYDCLESRMMRVKNQIIERLKNKKLKSEEVENLTADLKFIEGIMEDVNDRRQLVSVLWDFIIPSARRDRNFTLLQKQLEAIGNNDLFAKAAELRVAF